MIDVGLSFAIGPVTDCIRRPVRVEKDELLGNSIELVSKVPFTSGGGIATPRGRCTLLSHVYIPSIVSVKSVSTGDPRYNAGDRR